MKKKLAQLNRALNETMEVFDEKFLIGLCDKFEFKQAAGLLKYISKVESQQVAKVEFLEKIIQDLESAISELRHDR